MTEILSLFFLYSGTLFILLASIGFLRMEDVFLRSHVASMAPTLGKIGVLLALSFAFHDTLVTVKSLFVVVFLFLTAPVAAHLILRAAYRDRTPMTSKMLRDDYRDSEN